MLVNGSPISAAALAGAVLVAYAVCRKSEFIGSALGVIDRPDTERKRHEHPTPQVGGIAIIAALALWAAATTRRTLASGCRSTLTSGSPSAAAPTAAP